MDVVFAFAPARGNRGAFKAHLGVGYLQAALAGQGIASTQYCTERPGNTRAVAREILAPRPRVVGLTVYESNYALCLNLARALKAERPETRVIFGGPAATFSCHRILFPGAPADLCVLGEADETGPTIFKHLLEPGPDLWERLAGVSGVAFRASSGELVSTGLPPLAGSSEVGSATLDSLTSPYETGVLSDGRPGVLTGRGCNQNCVYCCFAALGRRKIRLHSADRVLSELTLIRNAMRRRGEWYAVSIHDDTFSLLVPRAKRLCEEIAARNLGLQLNCITRADCVDGELLRLMKQAGFNSIAFGLESAVPSVLRACGKVRPPNHPDPDLTPEREFIERVRSGVRQAHKLGLIVGVSIILGLPGETPRDAAATLEFVRSLPVNFYMHNYLQVLEGTPLWDTWSRHGISLSDEPLGFPVTIGHSYDVSSIPAATKSLGVRDARSLRSLVANSMLSCSSTGRHRRPFGAIVLRGGNVDARLAGWLSGVLSVGGLLVHLYEKTGDLSPDRLTEDRLRVVGACVPCRYYVQAIPLQSRRGSETWHLASELTEMVESRFPALLRVRVCHSARPLERWAACLPSRAELCDPANLFSDPESLGDFQADLPRRNLFRTLSQRRVPPALLYPGRFSSREALCTSLSRIEVWANGVVRTCVHGKPLGCVGDTVEAIRCRYETVMPRTPAGKPACPLARDGGLCQRARTRSGEAVLNWLQVSSRLETLLTDITEQTQG